MSNTIPSDVKELVMPAIKQQIRSKIEEAFKLAVYAQNFKLVDETYQEIKASYLTKTLENEGLLDGLENDPDLADRVEAEFERQMTEVPTDGPDNSVNLVTRKPLSATKRRKVSSNKKRKYKKRKSKASVRKSTRPNAGGSSQYRGVSWDKATGKWRSRILYHGRHLELGKFDDEVEAAKAYDKMKFKAKGDVATLNFPNEFI